jgi:HSF-type DNA-binding
MSTLPKSIGDDAGKATTELSLLDSGFTLDHDDKSLRKNNAERPTASRNVPEFVFKVECDGKVMKNSKSTSEVANHSESDSRSLKDNCSPPLYQYRDFSRELDMDPLTSLTPPGRVPNFPAKMHSILSRSEFEEIISWMPHGRSWRVLKPREFEMHVIPKYFEHSKFSSFIRQANGWGFRRVTQGRDRNTYYHERFLRGLPHLCKDMRRPGVSEKGIQDTDFEPDFYKISEMFPLPMKAEDETILLDCTVNGGPKARMPVFSGAYLSADKIKAIKGDTTTNASCRDNEAMAAFQNGISLSESQLVCPNADHIQISHQKNLNQMPFHPHYYFSLQPVHDLPSNSLQYEEQGKAVQVMEADGNNRSLESTSYNAARNDSAQSLITLAAESSLYRIQSDEIGNQPLVSFDSGKNES